MPVSTVEPSDSCKVWDFKALQKSGSVEVLRFVVSGRACPLLFERAFRFLIAGFGVASPYSETSAASDTKARVESPVVV